MSVVFTLSFSCPSSVESALLQSPSRQVHHRAVYEGILSSACVVHWCQYLIVLLSLISSSECSAFLGELSFGTGYGGPLCGHIVVAVNLKLAISWKVCFGCKRGGVAQDSSSTFFWEQVSIQSRFWRHQLNLHKLPYVMFCDWNDIWYSYFSRLFFMSWWHLHRTHLCVFTAP